MTRPSGEVRDAEERRRPRDPDALSVLFVCTGNICRSPMAATVFDALVSRAGLSGRFAIDSAALRPHHLGRPADPRAIAATDRRGYAWLDSRARQVGPDDFARSLVVGMGEWHVAQLRRLAPDAELRSLARYVATRDVPEVPDPYHGDAREFEHALDLVEEGCAGLLRALGVRRPAVELTTGSAA